MTEAQKEVKPEVGFVTKKVLVTFDRPIAVMAGETCVFTQAAICEYDETQHDVSDFKKLRVIGFTDGRPLTKTLELSMRYGVVVAMMYL